ncbi:putative chalcone--flavonone isomerase 3 [Platanthera guangdongensis]|uniref:Chalcone-flavonone isomerase family protein n=1 Tax=Platanthera guangdongensis TaxID=2320717 RepID=A0ABR2LUQ7_9ASPA
MIFLAGITDVEIHFLQIKYYAIGIYIEKDVINHLENWKGKRGTELEEDDLFFDALVSGSITCNKIFRIVVIKEIKGSQFGVQLESAVRDRLAEADKYEEEEEEELEKITEFFQSKYMKKDSIMFATEGKGETKIKVENAKVAEMMQKWYLGGSAAVSPSTVKSLSEKFEEILLGLVYAIQQYNHYLEVIVDVFYISYMLRVVRFWWISTDPW